MGDNVLNTPGLMDPSTEFGSIMQHAMKIKGAQMESERKNFETWPLYFQNTLWMQGVAVELRERPLEERLVEAAKIKEFGNDHFRKKACRSPSQCRPSPAHLALTPPDSPSSTGVRRGHRAV